MSISPFSEFANCTLIFQVAGTGVKLDALGNRSPQLDEISVLAMLKIVSAYSLDLRSLQQYQRIEADAVALSGYCVQPNVLPLAIVHGAIAKLTFNQQPGEFRLMLINPPYGREGIGAILEQEAGSKIIGWFIPDRSK
jgi:hypothetical protein